MNLYHILFDWQPYYVEAETLGAAVTAWRQHVSVLWGDDYDGTEEPDSITLVHDKAVVKEENASFERGRLRNEAFQEHERWFRRYCEANNELTSLRDKNKRLIEAIEEVLRHSDMVAPNRTCEAPAIVNLRKVYKKVKEER